MTEILALLGQVLPILEEIAVYAGHQIKDGASAITTTMRYTLPCAICLHIGTDTRAALANYLELGRPP